MININNGRTHSSSAMAFKEHTSYACAVERFSTKNIWRWSDAALVVIVLALLVLWAIGRPL